MKLSTVLLGIASFAVAVSARARPFKLKVENSLNADINGFYLENDNGVAKFDAGGEPTVAAFDDTPPFVLFASGSSDGTSDIFLLVPAGSTEVENLLFGDFAIAEARFTEFHIRDGYLTYGDEADKFVAFPASTGTGWVIRWVPEGAIVTANGFAVDLEVEYI